MSEPTTNGVSSNAVGGITPSQVDGMDQETRLMVLCYTMLDLLDDRMQGQMDVIQARNDRAAQLKGVVSDLNQISATLPADADPDTKFPPNPPGTDSQQALMSDLAKQLDSAKISGLGSGDLIVGGQITKSQLDAANAKVTGMMDSDTTIQQLDMFTLQSVFSKRNETFELMSNTLKKSQDTKSTLVRNF